MCLCDCIVKLFMGFVRNKTHLGFAVNKGVHNLVTIASKDKKFIFVLDTLICNSRPESIIQLSRTIYIKDS